MTEEEVSIWDWKPTEKKERIIQSQWRKEHIGDNFNQHVDIDDLRKIERYISRKLPDFEIMQNFGINAQTLVAIKEKRYCPFEGIENSNLSKITDQFTKLKVAIKDLQKIVYELMQVNNLSTPMPASFDKRIFNSNQKKTPDVVEVKEDKC